MPQLLTVLFILYLLFNSVAFAATDDNAFDGSIVLASSSLSSVVTGSTVNLDLTNSPLNIGANSIGNNAFTGVTGVIAVLQNTGINASIEQAVTVAVGTIRIGLTQ